MKVLKSIALLFFLCWVGDIVSAYLPFPIPGSIISMALLFILLLTGVIKQHHVQPTGDFAGKYGHFIPAQPCSRDGHLAVAAHALF